MEPSEREASGKDLVKIEIGENETVLAHPELLSCSIGNVLRNAVRYAGQAGIVVCVVTLQIIRIAFLKIFVQRIFNSRRASLPPTTQMSVQTGASIKLSASSSAANSRSTAARSSASPSQASATKRTCSRSSSASKSSALQNKFNLLPTFSRH